MKQSQPSVERPPTDTGATRPFGFWVTLAAAIFYCAWLGAHWLPLGYSEHELAASASRVWDIKHELAEHHHLPWWTPNFMCGSSYGLNHARGFYLLPWLLVSTFTDLQAAGKLMALGAIFLSAVAMYFCSRHFLRHEWAATLGALAYMLHPGQLIRAAGAEHMTISIFFPFVPLLWLTFARALETNKARDIALCAATVALAMWTDNKQALVVFVFLFLYLIYWVWPAPRRTQWQTSARTCVVAGLAALAVSAFVIVPGVIESRYVKLFVGDPLVEWQKNYAFKSVLGLVDRDGALMRATTRSVIEQLQAHGGQVRTPSEADSVRRILTLQSDSPEKYAGIVALLLIAVAALFNRRRVNRWLFWFFICMMLLSFSLSTGLSNVWDANAKTWGAIFGLDGVPSSTQAALALTMGAGVVCLVLLFRRKLTTARKRIIAGVALAVFLFVPSFKILASLPYFKEIRAPFVFYDVPATFFVAILAGFFVSDFVEASKWRAHAPKIVGVLAILLFIDYWPYEKPMKQNDVPARTLQNLQASYGALRADADWVKTYSFSGRYFHLLGPMYGGKPQVYEAFYNWMSPLGIGLLNQNAWGSLDNHRAFLNLLGARYVVFDKTDPSNTQGQPLQILAAYRQLFTLASENEDFAVFRNDNAHPYVTAYARACLFDGDVHNSPQIAIALAARNWPLVHGQPDTATTYERVYRDGDAPLPPRHDGETVSLTNVALQRADAQTVHIKLSAPSSCLAVIAESYYPFWTATIDGEPTEVLRVSCGLMGVRLPAGAHEIVLHYAAPRAYAVAAVVSVIGLIACFVVALKARS